MSPVKNSMPVEVLDNTLTCESLQCRTQQNVSAKNFTDRQIVETALLADPAVENCIVLAKNTESTSELVAYIVCAGSFCPEQLHSHLQTILPSALLPSAYVPLSILPLTATGEVDEQMLQRLDVIDSDLVQKWETTLRSHPQIAQAAVIVQDHTVIPPLHLSDLLPESTTPAIASPSSTTDEIDATDTSFDLKPIESIPMAMSYGGSLPEESDAPTTLAEVLTRAADQALGSIFYLQPDGSEIAQSYRNLRDDAERILSGLRKLGLKPQDQVIFQLELNQDIIAAFWGCILGGFIPVIIGVPATYNTANNAVDKLCNVWQLLDCPLILTSAKLQPAVRSLSQLLPSEHFQLSTIEDLSSNEPDKSYHPSKPHDPAFFNLTSGSTGMPKCISLTHWNLISRARGTNTLSQHSNEDVILNWLPFDHIGSISDWHIRCVYLGCTLIYAHKEYILGRPLNWLDLIDKYRITHSWAPNFAYALIYDAIKQEPAQKWDLSCVKSLLTAGEAVSSTAVTDFIEHLANHGFKQTAVRPAFGMAEMGSGVTYYQPTVENPLRFHTIDKSSLSGRVRRVDLDHPNCTTFTDLGPVIPGVSIRIVDQENAVLPEDTIGYLQIKGDAVFSGYYKNPEVNKEIFVEDNWFNTGDLGFICNGHLVVTGRAKETIIINGANYYNHEIEAVVEEIDQVDVSYTAACAVRDAKGTTDKLAIFFSATSAPKEREIELIKQIRQTVVSKVGVNPDYLIPVPQSAIPKTAIGKIQRSQLSKCFEAGEFDSILKQIDIRSSNANTIPDWFYRRLWLPQKAVSSTQNVTDTYLVFVDSLGLGEALSTKLNDAQACILVEPGTEFVKLERDRYYLDPSNFTHYQQLFSSLAAENLQINQILHLWNYQNYNGEIASPEALEQALDLGSYSLLFLIQALAEIQSSDDSVRLLVAGSYTQPTSPSDKVAAEKAPILGLIKAAAQEITWLDCRYVDLPVDAVETNATYILQEIQAQRSLEVAYRNGQRLVPYLEKVDLTCEPKQELPFQSGGMYLLSGGLGGIGVEIAKFLLQRYSAKLLLIGKTPLPARNEWENYLQQKDALAEKIQAYLSLEKLGGEIKYEAVDICDRTRVEQVVESARSAWNCELNGIIHLAGTAPECSLAKETQESLATTLHPKVLGTWVLHQLIKNQPDSIFISFSSLASFFGGAAIGAYAAANSFLDCFSHYQRYQLGLQSYCFAWGMWDEVGMSRNSQVKNILRAKGYYAVTALQGIHSLAIGLAHNQAQLLVGLDGSNRNIQRYTPKQLCRIQTLAAYYTVKPGSHTRLEDLSVRDRFGTFSTCTLRQIDEIPLTNTGEVDRERLTVMGRSATTQHEKPRNEVESLLASIWQDILGVSQIGIHDNFFELGGSSLQAARLFAEIEKSFGKNLPLATLFEASTIAQLVNFLGEQESTLWSSVVPIQPHGSQPPLFCIHGAGGNILMYRQLISYLGSDQPLYGIQPKGLDGKETPLNRIPEMAAAYVKEMRELQPKGPYYLTGLSAGGLIAYEMAQVLRSQGQQVALLALIDPHAPGYPTLLPIVPRLVSLLPRVAYHLVGRIPSRISKLVQSKQKREYQLELVKNSHIEKANSPQTHEQLPLFNADITLDSPRNSPQQRRSLKEKLEYFSLWTLKYTPWAFLVPRFYLDEASSLPTSLQKIQEANVAATLAYEPQVYPGQAILFRASEQPPGCYSDPLLGWGELITGGIEVYDVPGYHSESLLYEERSVRVLGPQLKACMQRVQIDE